MFLFPMITFRLFLLFSLFSAFSLPAYSQAQETITLNCLFDNCPEAPSLYSFDGLTFTQRYTANKTEEGKFVFEIPKSSPQYFYLGHSDGRKKPLILGSEDELVIRGNCKAIQASAIGNSRLNQGYESLKKNLNRFDRELNTLATQYRQAFQNDSQRQEVEQKMANLDKRRKTMLDSLREKTPFLGHIAALQTYLSYQNNGSQFSNEIEYFVNTYFQFADLSDPVYNDIVYVYEAFRSYSRTLASIGLQKEDHERLMFANLSRIPQESMTYRYALGGAISALRQKKHPNFSLFAQHYIELFGKDNSPAIQNLKEEIEQAKMFLPGAVAPDFSQNTPEGKEVKLSDFRGKVTLIDFWASWCGPCRRENPNVVKLYNQYKDQGFDILGVSLDRDEKRWLDAIAKDGLEWTQVSDLKGWKNQVAKLYGVSSIPHTVLLDGEGRIIQRNLRGEKLEEKLAEIFEK
jgi:peroxiredoxin